MTEPENFVGVERVRQFLAYKNERAVRRLVAQGLPHRRLNGQLRFRLSEVENWLTEQDAGGQGEVVQLPTRRTA